VKGLFPGLTLGKATRDAYGEALRDLGREHDDIVVLDADLAKSTKSALFGEEFPDRFFNVGIQEANMVGMAGGFASCGKVPFISSFACFVILKGFDQLRMAVAYPHLNVKVAGSHGGISPGEDGASQQSVEDLALAVALPHFAVLVPSDGVACKALTFVSAEHQGPVFLRTGRPKAPVIYSEGEQFPVGGSKTLQTGTDATIVACGLLVFEALQAADMAAEIGLSVGVIDAYSIKPIDAQAIAKAARESGAILTAEEHLTTGGLGSLVAQVVAEHHPVPMAFVGLKDRYSESGTPEALMEAYGFTAKHLFEELKALVEK
jgi:transketolase